MFPKPNIRYRNSTELAHELESTYSKAKLEPTKVNLENLRESVADSLSGRPIDNRSTNIKLMQAALDGLGLYVIHVPDSYIAWDVVKNCMDKLSQPGIVEAMRYKKENMQILATVCQVAAIYATRKFDPPFVARIRQTVSRAFNTRVTSVSSAMNITDMFYGPGVWDLYRQDVNKDEELPVHLFRLGITLKAMGAAEQKDPPTLAADLPNDMS